MDCDEGEKEGNLEVQSSTLPKENVNASNQDDAEKNRVHGDIGPLTEEKSRENGHEEFKENHKEKGMSVTDPKEVTSNDKDDESLAKKVRAGAKKLRIPKFPPVQIPLEERKFCIFHDILEIPLLQFVTFLSSMVSQKKR